MANKLSSPEHISPEKSDKRLHEVQAEAIWWHSPTEAVH